MDDKFKKILFGLLASIGDKKESKLMGVSIDFDITLPYLPRITNTLLNGQPLRTLYQNANYADTSFRW